MEFEGDGGNPCTAGQVAVGPDRSAGNDFYLDVAGIVPLGIHAIVEITLRIEGDPHRIVSVRELVQGRGGHYAAKAVGTNLQIAGAYADGSIAVGTFLADLGPGLQTRGRDGLSQGVEQAHLCTAGHQILIIGGIPDRIDTRSRFQGSGFGPVVGRIAGGILSIHERSAPNELAEIFGQEDIAHGSGPAAGNNRGKGPRPSVHGQAFGRCGFVFYPEPIVRIGGKAGEKEGGQIFGSIEEISSQVPGNQEVGASGVFV